MSKHQEHADSLEVLDPVCGMTITAADAVGHVDYQGQTYHQARLQRAVAPDVVGRTRPASGRRAQRAASRQPRPGAAAHVSAEAHQRPESLLSNCPLDGGAYDATDDLHVRSSVAHAGSLDRRSEMSQHLIDAAVAMAHVRGSADLPFAADIATAWGMTAGARVLAESLRNRTRYELRFRSVSELARRSGRSSFIEVAAGLSSRAIEFVEAGEAEQFVDTDVAEVTQRKHGIVSRLIRPHLVHRLQVVVLDLRATDRAARLMAVAPVGCVVICEGFLSTLSILEIKSILRDFAEVLRMVDGIMVTPDLFTSDDVEDSSRVEGETFSGRATILEMLKTCGLVGLATRQLDLVPSEQLVSLPQDGGTTLHGLDRRLVWTLSAQ